ncbi:MAG: STAS domain-containing protein [Chitinispirillaceae bacterium]|jgi:anti-sigma B factor antagonist|nr:STAS domain-containing protein [Chitinispirillaceae bacterium]
MSIKIRIRKERDIPVMEIAGEISGENVGKIASRLERLRDSDAKTIVVDLSETTFIDSHGLGVFVYSWRLLETEQRYLVFIRPQGFIMNMFQNTNLDRVFRIVDSIEEI